MACNIYNFGKGLKTYNEYSIKIYKVSLINIITSLRHPIYSH